MKKAMILLMIIVLTLSYKVKASGWQNIWISNATYSTNGGAWSNTAYSNDGYYYINTTLNGTASYAFKFDGQRALANNAGALYFNVKFDIKDDTTIYNSENGYNYTCNVNSTTSPYNGQYVNEINYFDCYIPRHSSESTVEDFKWGITMTYNYSDNIGYNRICMPIASSGNIYSFKCPVYSNNVSGISLKITTNRSTNFDVGVFNLYNIEFDNTQTIIDNQNEIKSELNQTQTYTEDMNTNMTGVNETVEYSTQEQNLKSQLDLNTSMLDDLYIDSSTSGFIWDLVGGLRNMNPAIITLMSTMLGLGVIRLILNR